MGHRLCGTVYLTVGTVLVLGDVGPVWDSTVQVVPEEGMDVAGNSIVVG